MAARCGFTEPNRRGSIRTGILTVEPISISPQPISIHPSHRLPIESGDDSDDSARTPPLKFYSLANKQGSHGSIQQPSLFLPPMDNIHVDHRVSSQPVQNGRRESLQLIGRSSGDIPWCQSPSSPVEHRRTSIASSSSPQNAFSQRSHNPRRRPSSSSSAISISTLRPHSPSTFTASGFSNGLKLPPRQSSLSPLHPAPIVTPGFTPGQALPTSPTTSSHSIDPLTVLPIPPSSSLSSSDIQDFRFGSAPASTHLTNRFPRKLSQDERSLESPTGEDEEMNDRAREKFRQQLLNAGLSSISISLPTVPLGSNVRSHQTPPGFPPLQTPLSPSFFEPTTSPFTTSYAPSPSIPLSSLSPSAYSSVTVSPKAETANGRRQSASYFGSASYNRNSPRPPSDSLPKFASPNDDSGHSGDDEAEEDRSISPLRTRNSPRMLDVKRLTRDKRILQPEDGDGSGIEDESDSDGSRHEAEGLHGSNRSSSISRRTDALKPSFDLDNAPGPPPFETFTFESRSESQPRSRSFPHDRDFSSSIPPLPLHSPKNLTPLSPLESRPQHLQLSAPHDLTNDASHPEIMILPNTPRLNSSYTSPERTPINNTLRRPSLSPSIRSPSYTLKEGHLDFSSNILNPNTQRSSSPPPPRSLSDSAVPRRPSLAAEVGVVLPPVLARASVGALSDEVEWDMNFILGDASLSGIGNDLIGGPSRKGSLSGTRALNSMITPFGSPPEIDSFAEFVQGHDPLFNKTRLAWTLSRVPSTPTGWSFPATGGYTIIDFPADPTASSTGSYSISSSSTTSFPFAQQPHKFQNQLVDSIIRGNRPPSPSWGLRRKGKGWGIIPFQDSKTEIKFGPKGKWRAEGGRPRPPSRGTDNYGLPKTTEDVRKRQGLPRTSMATDSTMDSRLNSRSQSWAEEKDEDFTRTGPIPSDGARVTFEDDYLSLAGMKDSMLSGPPSSSSSSTKPRSIKSPGQGDHSKPIPIQSDPYDYASSSISGGQYASTPRATEIVSPPARSFEKTRPTEKSKKTAKWLLTLKQAGAALGSSSSSSTYAGGGGGKKQSREPDQPTGNYIPPWMSAGTTGRKEEIGLASKFKFKRRSISDGRRNSREKASFSGGEDSSGVSLRSRRGFETDDETDDGEAREGKAWEDVPTEALAMVIPLAAISSSTTADPVRSAGSAADAISSRSTDSSSSEFVNHTSRWSRSPSPGFSFNGISPLVETDSGGGTPDLDSFVKSKGKTTTTASATTSTAGGLKVAPPPPENSLLVYFVPFGDGHLLPSFSESPSNTFSGPSKLFSHMRLKRNPSQMFHRSMPSSGLKPSSQESTRYQQSSYPSPQQPSSSFQSQDARSPTSLQPPSPFSAAYLQSFSLPSGLFIHPGGLPITDPRPGSVVPPLANSTPSFSSFRIVARVVDPSDLTFIPSWPSWESQQNPSLHATPEVKLSEPGTNPETSAKDSRTGRNDPTVVGVCHGYDHGVEFVREGWERLGFVPASMNEEKAETDRIDLDENLEGRLLGILGCLSTACVAIMSSTAS
ncbi:hypothetical protein [Phaffia rhodozyma]|uniref:Uncharacterized protein n=1 Tax=Phaffia rhodozyma TaxID=264483 RepID=A0A0F7SM10_PHARH|nr:hypothetical protein [Phaffia rhodozyma]